MILLVCMRNKILKPLNFVVSFFLISSGLAHAAEKRTDGPPGSEWADFSKFEGDLSVGAHFGALLPTRSSQDSNFSIALDGDYRPYNIFGIRLTYLQGLSSPRTSIISITPLVHTHYSNLKPYAVFGPGLAIVNHPSTSAKFSISGGVGGDIEITDHFEMGMLWMFHSVIDSGDFHSLTARFAYKF